MSTFHCHKVFPALCDQDVVLFASVLDPSDALCLALQLCFLILVGCDSCSSRNTRSHQPRQRWVVWLLRHNLFLLSMLGCGPSTPVRHFTRNCDCPGGGHLVSQSSARLEPLSPAEATSLTLLVVLLCSSSLRPRFFHLGSSSKCCRELNTRGEVHVQCHRHPRCHRLKTHSRVAACSDQCFTPVHLECCQEFQSPLLPIFFPYTMFCFSVHRVRPQSPRDLHQFSFRFCSVSPPSADQLVPVFHGSHLKAPERDVFEVIALLQDCSHFL